MTEQPDLIARLQHAAASVIKTQRPSLQRDPSSLRSITLEFELDRLGQLTDCELYIGRKLPVVTPRSVRS